LKTLRIQTLGCSKNTVDTEHLLSQVEHLYKVLPEGEGDGVDTLLLNTCGFIGDAKQESIDAIMQAVALKNSGAVGRIFVMGCLSQRYADSLPSLIPEVDGWFGARELSPIVKALGGTPVENPSRYRTDALPYAYLKISEGCDRRCSYCAIPFIRGAHKSVPVEKLVEEASALSESGVRELLLIAQDTTYYGLDIYRKRSLGRLLDALSDVKGIEWLRIHYSHPADFPEDVLEQLSGNPKVCRYLDIPLQHASDKVLSLMHRQCDGKWTRDLVERLRKTVPGVALRTTMIVGHPGEGRKEFQELLDFVRWARFERLGAFQYSEEEGTFDALNNPDTVAPATKRRRLDKLMATQREISLSYNQSRVGSLERVLVDGVAPGGELVCRSEFESPEVDGEIIAVYPEGALPPKESPVGKFLTVRITGADDYDLRAVVENKTQQ